jgi:hypothetical protein
LLFEVVRRRMILPFTCGLFTLKVLLLYGFFDSFFSSLIHKEIIQEKNRLHALSRAASTIESALAAFGQGVKADLKTLLHKIQQVIVHCVDPSGRGFKA